METKIGNVREIETPEEVESLEGFVPELPFDQEDYKSLVGGYNFPRKVRCCFNRGGRICRTLHNHGFVVRLHSGLITLIGNECARKIASNEKISHDIQVYKKEAERQDKLDYVKKRLKTDIFSVDQLVDIRNRVLLCDKLLSKFTKEFPATAAMRLGNIGRTTSNSLSLAFEYQRPYKDEHGLEQIEFDVVRREVYKIKGVRFLNNTLPDRIKREVATLKGYRRAFDNIDKNTSTKRLNDISSQLRKFKNISEDIEKLESYRNQFLENDFRFFCFLSPYEDEQVEIAEILDGELLSYEVSAKKMLFDLERKLLKMSGAQDIIYE